MEQVDDLSILDTVTEILSELVSKTENCIEKEKISVNNEISNKSDLNTSDSGSSKSDLPVRRSSRIQRLSIKKDEVPAKQGQKSNKNSKVPKIETNTLPPEHTPATDCIDEVVKSSVSIESSENDLCNKTVKGMKGADLKVDKQDSKSKVKTEKKRACRKRKRNSDEENQLQEPVGELKATNVSSLPDLNTDKISSGNENSAPISSEPNDSSSLDGCKFNETISINTNESSSLDSKDDSSTSSNLKPFKVKSRWCRSSELEGVLNCEPATAPSESTMEASASDDCISNPIKMETEEDKVEEEVKSDQVNPDILSDVSNLEPATVDKPIYEHIEENIYKFTRKKSKNKKQVRRMVCDCTLSKEEQEYGIMGCKEECLNRLLMIECGSRCPIGDTCSNKKFQKKQYIKTEVFKTEKKGWGLKALEDISNGEFLMEFVGEVLNHKEYRQRVKQYAKEKNVHCYFMALKTDEILDATIKGNYSRFINHSCDPNCETQKWTVNGELRVGVFAKCVISSGEEFTLDYKFQRYGREAQKCYCLSENCLGYIGGEKQISIDAYSGTKATTSKRKKGVDEKKREWEDMILEEEIEKLNSEKGLRNREETLKLARLMVRADDSATRHQILDIIIKTSEQACLRLFLDYHGLPLLWSWMTDIMDLDLKAKILQVLALLPITNKTMLLDSKVMSVVEKWVEEYNLKAEEDNESQDLSALPSSIDENSEPLVKKLKQVDFSDNETDSADSHAAVDNSPENSSTVNENNDKIDTSPNEPTQTDQPVTEEKTVLKEEDPLLHVKTSISNIGSDLLKGWKNLKEVFRIPKLEQQKRKEDELEADHKVLKDMESVNPKVEVTEEQSQIQVLISGKTTSFNNSKISFPFEVPEIDFQDDRRKKVLPLSQNPRLNRLNKPSMFKKSEDPLHRNIKEESDSSLDSASPLLSTVTSPVTLTNRPALLPTPNLINQSPVTFPPPVNTAVPPHPQLDQPPRNMFPPQMVYPPAQASFMVTAGPPPVLPPTTMPPPTVFPQPAPMLSQPPPTASITSAVPSNPAGFQLPPALPVPAPSTSQFIPNQVPGLANYPPGPSPYRNPSQPFYFLQQPPTVPSSSTTATFSESVSAQTSAVLPVPTVNTIPLQSTPFSSLSSAPHLTQSSNPVPMQSVTPLSQHAGSSVPIHSSTLFPFDQLSEPVQASPVPKEEAKPVKLPKSWRSATDAEGNVYYYHSVTRETQWDPPTAEQIENESEDEDSDSEESDSSDTPTYDEPKVSSKHSRRKSRKRKSRPAADTTVSFPVRPEIAKKIKELFRTKMSTYVIHCLNSYRKPDCKVGRITSNEDFKYLARKLTHYTMTKELKQCKNVEDLDCNDCVQHKARDFIKKYMSKYGAKFSRKDRFSPDD